MIGYLGGYIDYKDSCSKCNRPNHAINLYEGLCHECWRENNPDRTCVGCIHAKFGCDEDCCETIDCNKGVSNPLDCYSRDRVPTCEFNTKKVPATANPTSEVEK